VGRPSEPRVDYQGRDPFPIGGRFVSRNATEGVGTCRATGWQERSSTISQAWSMSRKPCTSTRGLQTRDCRPRGSTPMATIDKGLLFRDFRLIPGPRRSYLMRKGKVQIYQRFIFLVNVLLCYTGKHACIAPDAIHLSRVPAKCDQHYHQPATGHIAQWHPPQLLLDRHHAKTADTRRDYRLWPSRLLLGLSVAEEAARCAHRHV